MQKKSGYNLKFRICSGVVIILHLTTFGPTRDAFAFSAQSTNYKLFSGTLTEGGKGECPTCTETGTDTGIDTNTKLLLHADGTDGSTTFTDETGKTLTAIGNAQIDTAQSKFGGASGSFDGTGDYLSLPDSSDWAFGTGDFTVDFQVKFNTLTNYEA